MARPTTAPGSIPLNRDHNAGLPRVALKMATGTGKTVVMAMLIAWQTLNKVHTPQDARFTKRFLVRHPRHHHPRPVAGAAAERPRQLLPRARSRAGRPVGWARRGADRDRQLPPADPQGPQGDPGRRGQHPQDPHLRQGRRPLQGDPRRDGVAGAARLRRSGGKGAAGREIVVFNDEAHHCYQNKALDEGDEARQGGRRAQRGCPGVVPWPAGGEAQARHQDRLRPVGDTLLPGGLGPSGGVHLPLGGERLLPHGRDRERDREGAPPAGGRQRSRRSAGVPQPVEPGRQGPADEGEREEGRPTG